jgi:hypothetical protein
MKLGETGARGGLVSEAENGNSGVSPRVARFFLVKLTKTGKNVPNDRNLYQMAIKYTKWS